MFYPTLSQAVTVPRRIPIAAFLVVIASSQAVQAAPIAFEAQVDGQEITFSLESTIVDEIERVSLPLLIEELGGGLNQTPTRTRVELAGATAWVTLNDDRIYALSIFSLEHPIRSIENEILIALDDVPDFFSKAFRVPITYTRKTPPRRPVDDVFPLLAPDEPTSRTGAPTTPKAPDERRPAEVIVIDAGHGGRDPGLETGDGVTEKTLTFAIAAAVADRLAESFDGRVFHVRKEDVDLDPHQRALAANDTDGDLLVSIHAAASLSPQVQGAVVFHKNRFLPGTAASEGLGVSAPNMEYADESLALATAISSHLATITRVQGVAPLPNPVMDRVLMPAVLIEVGYLTNPRDSAWLATEEAQQSLGAAIAAGIAEFIAQRNAGNPSGKEATAGNNGGE